MIGSEIGDYRIIEHIAAGSMGAVYKAIDSRIDRVVAVKALSPEFSSDWTLLERLRGEVRAQAQLKHPNVAAFEAFLVEDNAAYLVMEFVDGWTFRNLLAQYGPIGAEEAVPLFRQALAGIGYAHRMGIVHGDIKLSNLMLTRNDTVKVRDFGIAGITAGEAGDARPDVYGLGAALYEALTGVAPFRERSEADSPRNLDSRIPRGIEHAILKALEKDPDRRFQSAEEFSAALEHPEEFVSAATVAPAVPAPAAKQAFWTGQRKVLAGLAALVCVAAVWVLFTMRKLPPARRASTATREPALSSVPSVNVVKPSPMLPLVNPAPPPRPEVAPLADRMVVPAGTSVSVRVINPIDPKVDRAGEEFIAKLTDSVSVRGLEAFEAGDNARLRLEQTENSEDSGKPEWIVELVSITSGGRRYPLRAEPFRIKGGFLRKKKVAAGAEIEFRLSVPAPVSARLP